MFVKTPRPEKSRAVRVLAISQAGPGLAAGMSDGVIYAWESIDLTDCQSLHANGRLNDMRFSEAGELVIADRNIRHIKLDNGPPKRLRSDAANYGTVRFQPGRRRLLTVNGKGKVMTVDLDSGDTSAIYCCSTIWGEVDFIDKGDRAVWGGHWPGIWQLAAGKLLGRPTVQREVMTFGPIAIDPFVESQGWRPPDREDCAFVKQHGV